MSFEITTAFVDQFKDNILLLSQQKESRFWQTARVDDQTGDVRYVERIGATAAVKKTTRHGDTPLISTPHSRRKMTMEDWHWADLIDSLDKVKMLIDPESTYAQNGRNAFNRTKDDIIIAALGGAAYAGHEGQTTVNNFDAGECRLVNGDGAVATAGSDHSDTTATVITLDKILTCKQLLDEAEVDPERQRYFVMNARNYRAMLQIQNVASSDYNTIKALVRGEIDTYCGFKWLRSERLPTDATETDCINCYAWAGDAIVVGEGQDIKTRISERSDKNYSTQVYIEMALAATRVEGPAVVEINLLAA